MKEMRKINFFLARSAITSIKESFLILNAYLFHINCVNWLNKIYTRRNIDLWKAQSGYKIWKMCINIIHSVTESFWCAWSAHSAAYGEFSRKVWYASILNTMKWKLITKSSSSRSKLSECSAVNGNVNKMSWSYLQLRRYLG